MNTLQSGYAQININPTLGIGISGYFIPRFAKGFLDDLEASCLALTTGSQPVLVISVDNCHIDTDISLRYRKAIAEAAHIPAENIFLSCTHTHTGPMLKLAAYFEADETQINRYADFLQAQLCTLAATALSDLRPTRMGFAVAPAPERIAYIRRYRMKDGSTMTCPPINDPDIVHPLGELDQRVNVLRFDREGADSVVILNYGLHADTVNGEMISADWPSWTRATIEKALDGTKCMYINGAQGDVGSTNIHPTGGDMNDTEISFDNEMKSPGMARFVGRALAGTILQVYDKVEYVDVDAVSMLLRTISVASNMPDPADIPRAHEYKSLHDAGRDDLIPFEAMELTTVVAEAIRMCRLEHGPAHFQLTLTGLQIGPVALVGISGEPFTQIGVKIKENDGWRLILPCGLVNGYDGYFPTQEAFEEGGYEARSSNYRSGVAEDIIQGASAILADLRKATQ